MDYYELDYFLKNFEIQSQKGGTCYANTIAGIICLASGRVKRREKLNLKKLEMSHWQI